MAQVSSILTEKIDEDKEVIWPQIIAICSACLVPLSCGIFFTWTSPAIPILLSEGIMTLDEASYLTVIPALTLVVTAPLAGKLVDVVGRKNSMLFTAIPHLIAWSLTAYGGSSLIYYLARIATGIADTFTFTAVPSYISEVATPKVRGTWGNGISLCIYIGNLLMNIVGAYCSISTTACIFMSVPIIFFCIFVFVPESPYFLLMKNREDEAKKSLQWLRRKKNVDVELKQLTADVKRQLSESGRFKDLFVIGSNRRAVIIGIAIRGAQQFCGISALSMYSQLIFKEGGSNFSASTSAIIFSASTVVFSLCSFSVIEFIGRRICMFISCLGCAIILSLQCIYFYLNSETDIDMESFRSFPIVGMILFVVVFACGLGLVPTVLIGELFSSSIKGKALCVMNIFFGIYISVSSKLFQFLMVTFGLYAPFGFYAICCFLSIISSYYFISDTRGKSLEQIQQDFKSKTKN